MQRDSAAAKSGAAVDAMHKLKEQSVMMKEALAERRGEPHGRNPCTSAGRTKNKWPRGISNEMIDGFYTSGDERRRHGR